MNLVETHSVSRGKAPGIKGPQRTCVACRRVGPQGNMMRLTCTPGGDLLVDWRRNLGGRGVYVCISKQCLRQALQGRRLDRSLKANVNYPPGDELLQSAIRSSVRSLTTLMGSGIGAAALFIGADAVAGALRVGKVGAIILATDFTAREDFVQKASGLPVCFLESKERLGELLGRRPTGVVAIARGPLAEAVVTVFARVDGLS